MKSKIQLVSTITPLRISFFGGGTDIPDYFEKYTGEIISAAINKYIYITAKWHNTLFEENYRLCYSKTEIQASIDKIENNIARECIRFLEIDEPLYISTISDLPTSSGLGSSSAFTVGLLNTLYALKGKRVSAAQLAEEACYIEINILKSPIGKQDQYAAAFGGFNHIKFNKNGRVEIDPIVLKKIISEFLNKSLYLIWTGIKRDASEILLKQVDKINYNTEKYEELKKITQRFKNMIIDDDDDDLLIKIGNLLNESWLLKKNLEDSITNVKVDNLFNLIMENGAYGAKLCGAGGGGFIVSLMSVSNANMLQNLLSSENIFNINIEPLGSRILNIKFE